MNQFQGKQNSTIPDEIYDQLRDCLRAHNLILPGRTKQEQYQLVTKQHIYMFLKETHHSKHYEDVNLIYHNLTGKALPNISHLEEHLLHDFDILSNLYDQLYIKQRRINRKNFINTQYVLYQLLKRHRYPCEKSDFNFLKTIERQCFHDTICSELFKQLGWNFTHVF
jgi:hypothetical protein